MTQSKLEGTVKAANVSTVIVIIKKVNLPLLDNVLTTIFKKKKF
jgi:hypothetical protein